MSLDLKRPIMIKSSGLPVRYVGTRTDGRIIVEMPVSDKRLVSVLLRPYELENVPPEPLNPLAALAITGALLAVPGLVVLSEWRKTKRPRPYQLRYWFR